MRSSGTVALLLPGRKESRQQCVHEINLFTVNDLPRLLAEIARFRTDGVEASRRLAERLLDRDLAILPDSETLLRESPTSTSLTGMSRTLAAFESALTSAAAA